VTKPTSILCHFVHVLFHICFSWSNNCAANKNTNGVDNRSSQSSSSDPSLSQSNHARAARMDITQPSTRIHPPNNIQSSALTSIKGTSGVIKSFVLPSKNTGVVRVPATLSVSYLTTLLGTRYLLALSKGTLRSSNLIYTLQSSSLARLGSRIS
jgi:hypothetical protein